MTSASAVADSAEGEGYPRASFRSRFGSTMPPSHVRKRPAAGSALPPRAARSVARRRPAAATTAALLAKPDLAPRKRRRNAAYAAKHAARERARRRRRRQPEGPRDGFRMEMPSGPLLRYGHSPACRGTRLLPQRYQNFTPLSRIRDCMILGTRAPCSSGMRV